jgi:hypothetical protein
MTDPIALPTRPGVKADKPRMVDYGGPLKPILGGPVQNLFRLGTRHSIDITPANMLAEPHGRIWSSRLRRAKLFGAIMVFVQDGFTVGLPGAPVVDGAGQAGSTLALRGFRPGYVVREGQAFSLVYAGRRYLHFACSIMVADSTGRMALPIFPMLRVFPDDACTCEFEAPKIEGAISGNEVAWDRPVGNYYTFGAITITEDA